MASNYREQVFDVVRRVPFGEVTSYGAVGQALDRPVSGLLVGRALATCPDDVPWWRVVGRDGTLLTATRSPHIADDQRRRLVGEGREFTEDSRVVGPFLVNEQLSGA